MQIEVSLSSALYGLRQLQGDHVAVAVDVLRATSSICAAFQAGAEEIVPLSTLDGLGAFAARGYVVAAERGGRKVEGADAGNSPTEYAAMDLRGRRLVFSSTNGTLAILAARCARRLYAGAFANLGALTRRLAEEPEADVVVVCSGWKGDPCIEDTLLAGALIERLEGAVKELRLVNDGAMMALDLWRSVEGALYDHCLKATHVHRLQGFGADDDVRWCLQADTCSVVPYYDAEAQSMRCLR